MNTVDPLAQLRDIHLPEPVSWWPPAPGWWLVSLVLLAAVISGVYLVRRHLLQNRYRKVALHELENLVPGDSDTNLAILVEISALLRRVAIQSYGREIVATLTGESWLAFLDSTGRTTQFTQGTAKILGIGLYQPSIEADMGGVLQTARNWVKRHKK